MNPSTWIYPFLNQRYPGFPNLWMPESMGLLFIVKVPQALTFLDEATYLELAQTRLDWMIQGWTQETSQPEAQSLLATCLNQLDSAQEIPVLETDEDPEFALSQWRQAWAQTLILNNWRFQERMRHYDLTFPVMPILPVAQNYPDWLALHNETSLEEWLSNLTL